MNSLKHFANLKKTNIEEFEFQRSIGNFYEYRQAVACGNQKLIKLLECEKAKSALQTQVFIECAAAGDLDYVKKNDSIESRRAGNYNAFYAACMNEHKEMIKFLADEESVKSQIVHVFQHFNKTQNTAMKKFLDKHVLKPMYSNLRSK